MYENIKHKAKPIEALTISSTSNGYIVNAGCVTLVFLTSKQLVNALADYLADPEGFQKEHDLGYGGVQACVGLVGSGTNYPPMEMTARPRTLNDLQGSLGAQGPMSEEPIMDDQIVSRPEMEDPGP